MPKSYSDKEKEYIRERMKEEGLKCLVQYGVRRTTVDELVKRVKIPKGTFYLFYQSKEMLLFEIIMEQHDLVEQQLYNALDAIKPTECTAEQLVDIIYNHYKLIENTPVLKLLSSDEIELLARKLPPNVIEEHLKNDTLTIEKVLLKFPLKQNVDYKEFSAAFLAIYCATLHKNEIGEKNYDAALLLLIKGLVKQLL